MATLDQIDTRARKYADARDELAVSVQKLEDRIERLKRRYLTLIKKQVAVAAARKLDLKNAIEDSKDLFKRPRTIIMHGIKVGFAKGKGKIEYSKEDAERIVRLIEKCFPKQESTLIQIKKTPIKKALQNLTAADLKKLGITVEDAGDYVVIKPVDSQVEQLVDKLLKEKDEENERRHEHKASSILLGKRPDRDWGQNAEEGAPHRKRPAG
jgi:hypothetical protein